MKTKPIDFKPHSNALNQMIFEAKDLHGVSARTLHSWRQSGVLDDKRDPDALRRWNYFSPIDIVWIGILKEMKQLRLTHTEMIACKEILFEKIKAEDNQEYPALEYYSILILLYDQPVFIVISYNEGIDEVWMLDEKDYFLKLRSGEIENHTALSLHKAVKINLHPVYNLPEFSQTAGLTQEETKALEIIRSRAFRNIKITKRDGEISIIESTERIEDADDIARLLTEGKYQNIEIKQINGKIASAHRTTRTHFKK
ncbi:MerR family transcriptional regulator [Aquimarina latercula]|uniref:MerR family transcriptional regulator n=1 Tax=Aquimarina latercula TaxID=987 RepID=UPI00041F43B5|nr:MerR family transcriptional regulator [Aquimarina latercula]